MTGDMAGGAMGRAGEAAPPIGDGAAAGAGSIENASVNTAGHGDTDLEAGAHGAAAARAVPRPTRIPGVMVSGNSSASGLLSGPRGNIELESGTQMQLGIVAKD